MRFTNEVMQAVVILACQQHTGAMKEQIGRAPAGNWVVVPADEASRIGYVPHVSQPHAGGGCAIFGFGERTALATALNCLAQRNEDGSLCPDCIAYEWAIHQSHIAETARDPVCGKPVSCDDAFDLQHEGELFCFCSVNCRDRFQVNPRAYARPRRETVAR